MKADLKNNPRTEMNTIRKVSVTLDRARETGKRATRIALKEIKEIYNSMNRTRNAGFIRPEAMREEVYLRYYSLLPRGL
jgi:hypothetical protein